MKKIVWLLSGILIALIIFTVMGFVERNKVISEQNAVIQDVSSSYSEVIDSVGGMTGVVIMQHIDDVRAKMDHNKQRINHLEETIRETEGTIQKYINDQSVLQETANILKEQARDGMGLN